MPANKDEKNNTWYCKFYRSDLDGTRKQTTKRGFLTKKATQQWKRETKAADNDPSESAAAGHQGTTGA